ncbi:unnamed protein product [Closterium sp. NIES-53]
MFSLDYDVILTAMYAVPIGTEGACSLCVLPDPCIEGAALGASESALSGTGLAEALHTFTLDSSASRCFFRHSTTLTPLSAPVPVRLADPSRGPVLARSSTVLPCPAVPSGSLSCLHLPSFSTNLVSTDALQNAMVTTTTPGGQRVSICTCTPTGRHLATFTRRPGSSLYTLATEPPQTLLWNHRLGHPSLPRLRGMQSRLLLFGLPRSLPPLSPSPAPPCLPCVEGRQRAAPHSSSFPPTTAPLQTLHMDVKGQVLDVLIPWICAVRLQLRERFRADLLVLRLHSDRGGEFSSDLLREFCRGEGILQSFTLPNSPQQNGIAECRIGLVMEVARTSMFHVAAPHFTWPFAVRYAAHQLNLWPRVSLPETSLTLCWTREVGDASMFRFYHPTSRRVFPSQDVMFDESVPFYRLFPYRSAPPPPPPLFLAPGPPLVDPLPPQGPAPSGVSQVYPLPGTVPVEVARDSIAAQGAASGGAEPGGAEPPGVESGGAEPEGAEPGGAESEGAESGGAEPRGSASSGGLASALPRLSPRMEPLSPQQLREWFTQRTHLRSGATGAGDSTAGNTGAGDTGVTAGAGGIGGAATAGPGGACTRGTGATGTGSVGGTGVGDPMEPRGAGAGGTGAGGAGAGGARVGDTGAAGAGGGGTGAGGAGAAGASPRPSPRSEPLSPQQLREWFTQHTRLWTGAARAGDSAAGDTGAGGVGVTGLGGAGVTGLGGAGVTAGAGGTGARDPTEPGAARVGGPRAGGTCAGGARAGGAGAVGAGAGGTSAGGAGAGGAGAVDPRAGGTDCLTERREPVSRPASPVRTGRRVPRPRPPPVPGTHAMALRPSSVPLRVPLPPPPESSLPPVPDPGFTALCALRTDVLEDTQEDFDCLAAAVPRFASMLLATEGDPDAPDIPTPRSYAEAITGPYSSQWQASMDAEMASWKSTCTYVDTVPPSRANIVDGMWIFRGSLHEEIWLRRPPGFTGSFPAGTQWSLWWPVYGLRQALREWLDTLRATLAALGFTPSTVDPSLFLCTDTSLPPFYVLVYVDDLVFATADTKALALVKSELQKRHTCTDLGELRSYLGLHITWDRARRTITLTQSHMVHQSVEPSGPYPELVGCLMYLMTCTRPDFVYPLSLMARYVAPGRHRKVHWDAAKRVLCCLCSTSGMGLVLGGRGPVVLTGGGSCSGSFSASASNSPRHSPLLCLPATRSQLHLRTSPTSGMGLVLGGRGPVVLTGHADASWVDDSATQQSSQGYTFSLGSGSVSWRSTRSSSVLSSSCEAEIYAGAMAAQELRWLTYLLGDLGEQPHSPPQRGQLCLAYVATRANTADIFTKTLPPGDHLRFSNVFGLVPTLPHLLTA